MQLERARTRAASAAQAEQRAELARELLRPGVARPGVAQIERLVAQARADGLPATLHVDGEPRRLAPPLDASAFRIVQESLTNVRKHADDAPTSVRVTWGRTQLGLQVRDTGTGAPATIAEKGNGLAELRARAQLHGGELRAQPLPGSGFEVTARLPL